MRYITAGVVAVALGALALAQTPCQDGQGREYLDLDAAHWSCPFVGDVTARGLIDPCWLSPDGARALFCPDGLVRRRDMALWLLRGKHGAQWSPPDPTGVFDDVPPQLWDARWIDELQREGVTNGCSAAPPLFCPDDSVTRAQMAVFLLRAEHGSSWLPPPCTGIFVDVPCPGHWAADWIEELYREGITAGCRLSPPKYCPNDPVTRAQMAVFVERTFPAGHAPAAANGDGR